MSIVENYAEVKRRVAEACARSGRSPDAVTIIAVSKTKPVSDIQELLSQNAVDFGENKVQELCDKSEVLPDNLRWHMIGHLQRNKVKYLIGKTCLIHSVDSLRLAEQINEECEKKDTHCDILLEINAAGEESKFGISPEKAPTLARQISLLPRVHIRGLMTVAPYTENPESNRKYFQKIKEISVDIKEQNIDNVSMTELSMGMTGDYEVAIEEGATLVRVGTGIFGERDYNKKQ